MEQILQMSAIKTALIYRFSEIIYVYGDVIEESIHEPFGDGTRR